MYASAITVSVDVDSSALTSWGIRMSHLTERCHGSEYHTSPRTVMTHSRCASGHLGDVVEAMVIHCTGIPFYVSCSRNCVWGVCVVMHLLHIGCVGLHHVQPAVQTACARIANSWWGVASQHSKLFCNLQAYMTGCNFNVNP